MKQEHLSFVKYSGAGNDFILVNDLDGTFPISDVKGIKKLCHRQMGIGADGIILLQSSQQADYRMRILNADGTEAEMCGNGIRCLAKFIQRLGCAKDQITIETQERLIQVKFNDGNVCAEMGSPVDIQWSINTPIDSQIHVLHLLNTGVPHAVLFVEHIESVDVASMGKKIRHHPLFHPKGVNANFAAVNEKGEVHNRTFERGVEAETLACGTGATAVAIAASKVYSLKSPVKVHTQSGDILTISFQRTGEEFKDVRMEGSAQYIFQGQVPFIPKMV